MNKVTARYCHYQLADSRLHWLFLQGLCKNIGVSNFGIGHLEQLLKHASVTPAVNQIELSPFLQRQELVDYCRSKGIALEVLLCS